MRQLLQFYGLSHYMELKIRLKLIFRLSFLHAFILISDTHTHTHHRDEIISNYFERKPKKLLKNKQKFVIDGIH